ncbi:LysR substrate-binding domain-containing protein [Hoeflea sp. TYP-13]|uniref:LysR substrate-binding domain-containing protein n=1 Tax=Hoeflea sp. TYP-13 TaxID=3230023 RepID=UPI0034C5E4EA
MPRYLPKLNAVRAFEAAGRRQSFTGAAEELNVTHAAVSRHVRGLEQQLGVQLFKVVARGVELTETGRKFLEQVTPALDQISLAAEDLRQQQEGSISISCEPTFAMKWLMPRLGDFQERFPEHDVTLEASAHIADIQNNEFDLAIRHCKQTPDGLGFDLISQSPMYPYGVPEFRKADNPEDLLEYQLLHEDKGQLWTRWFARAELVDFVLPHKPRPFASLLAIEGALAGQGVVLASEELVAGDVQAGRLKRLSDIGLAYGGYCLLFRPETARRKSVADFRKWFVSATQEFRRESDTVG